MNVVITGATQGMGYALAEAFAAEGAHLALTARTAADLIKTKEIIAKNFPKSQIITVPADLGKANDVEAFAQKIKETWDSVEVLVNNAGLFYTGDMMEEDEDNLEKMMAVNLFGPVRLTRYLAPLLFKAEKAHVFNICSVASQKYFPGSGSYSVTKYALLGYSRALREEWKEQGVKVTSVLPGATYTRSWEGANIDPKRIMQPEDVAQAVVDTWKLPDTALIEELTLRPPQGDL
ncbi:MAG TPA: SDR family oxidoreductase [Saprospiraceae bacterium]|nr:SDR family oxidoreductase [Saprospiraceae bacterium]